MGEQRAEWLLRTLSLDLSDGVLMGVLNVTPDSFSDGGLYFDPDRAVSRGLEMRAQGAAIVDVGGESTRPGATPVSAETETERVLPVVEGLVAAGVVVSVDTSKPDVATASLDAGAEIVNDVNALQSDGMTRLVADAGCGVVIMHNTAPSAGESTTVAKGSPMDEVFGFLSSRVAEVKEEGVDTGRLAIDPGIGFGKAGVQNIEMLSRLSMLVRLGHPIVLGASRKRFLGTLIGEDSVEARDDATAATTVLGFLNGARVFRVHDVPKSRRALAVAAAMVAARNGTHGRGSDATGIHLGDHR